MKMEQRLVVPTGRAKMWDLLMDLARVGRCFPGVEQVTAQDDRTYQGVMKVRVGPVSINIAGKIVVLEQDRDRWHASLSLDGADRKVGGAVHGIMDLDLNEISPQETELMVSSEVSFMGKLGELGQPLIRKKADSVIQEFARNLSQEAASL
jgi:carbon monoxide dehydrogenase subunit G